MKIAITGASGHVGNNLCRMLIERGHQVRSLIHKNTIGLSSLPLEFMPGDVLSEPDLLKLCSGCEVIFHLAAHVSIMKKDPQCSKINIDACINLIKAARSTGIRRIIHFSSVHAFHEASDKELNESRELAVNSAVSYNSTKAIGQKIMMEASDRNLETVVLNPTAIIGPYDFRPSLLGSAIIRFYKGQNPVLIPGGYNWVDVRDVCNAAINAIDHGKSGECYLLAGNWQSLKEMVHEIQILGGQKGSLIEIPIWMAMLGAPLINLQSVITGKAPLYTAVSLHTLSHSPGNISSERAGSVLGFRIRRFSETIAATLGWFRDNKYL